MSAELCMPQRKIEENCLILLTAVLSEFHYEGFDIRGQSHFCHWQAVFGLCIGSVHGWDGLHIQDFKVPFHIYQVPTDLTFARVNYSSLQEGNQNSSSRTVLRIEDPIFTEGAVPETSISRMCSWLLVDVSRLVQSGASCGGAVAPSFELVATFCLRLFCIMPYFHTSCLMSYFSWVRTSGAKSAKQGSLHWAIQTNILPISIGIFQTMIYVIKIGLIEVVMNFCIQGFMWWEAGYNWIVIIFLVE